MKKYLLLTLVLIVCLGSFVYAEEPDSLRSIGTSRLTPSLSIGADNTAECFVYFSFYSGYSANLTLKLQEKTSSSSWKNIKTWSVSGVSGSGTRSYECSGLTKGKTYRLFLSAYVSKGAYIETIDVYTKEVIN